MVKNKHIVIGVTGGIAAYKLPLLVREFTKGGAAVRVVMTESAKEFVAPLTLSTVSNNEVIVGMFPQPGATAVNAGTWHIELAQWADVMLIAPATANTLSKLAYGYADNALTTLALALRCPLVVAPAMDMDMWEHSQTQENVTRLKELGYYVLPPDEGELASGLVGPGRLPELDVIFNAVNDVLKNAHRDFQRTKILVTAGPTHEPIDPVRFIGNRSSGKMGFAIAHAASQRGAEVTLVSGPVHRATPRNVRRIDVETAEQMHNAVMKHAANNKVVIMSAAVADFTPEAVSSRKMKREDSKTNHVSLQLKPTRDILKHLAEKSKGKIVVGFALETNNALQHAKTKLKQKALDFIVLNKANEEGAGFDTDTNIVTIISKSGKVEKLKKMPKVDVAHEILNRVRKLLK